MAALNFPIAPADGDVYPSPAIPNIGQWRWSQAMGTWQAIPLFQGANYGTQRQYDWPKDLGVNGQVLTTNGDGGMEWGSPSGGVVVPLDLLETIDGISTGYTLVKFGTTTAFSPLPSNNIVVFLGGVPQRPDAAFTVSNNTIVFTEPPAFGSIFHAISCSSGVQG